ncbi:MAG TPA: hypothetical protein VEZ90_14650 [Blastocatellia bacterium]|nr:hypothetical protein [Blastocatellia bacterium]
MASKATHDDAQLILRLYEIRREERMREARDWFTGKFFPQSADDFKVIQNFGAPENAYFRMVTSYWDMAASFIVQGVLNADLFGESGGEMIFTWAKMEPFLKEIREMAGVPDYFANIEKAIELIPDGKARVRMSQERLKQFVERQKGK